MAANPKNRVDELFPGQALATLEDAARVLGVSDKTIRNGLCAGVFPARSVKIGSRRLLVVEDLARLYDQLLAGDAPSLSVPRREGAPTSGRRRGRPTKREQAERQHAKALADAQEKEKAAMRGDFFGGFVA